MSRRTWIERLSVAACALPSSLQEELFRFSEARAMEHLSGLADDLMGLKAGITIPAALPSRGLFFSRAG
ncbi:hypothetical protein SLG_26410 [Sphingobium sp. SYK-6]|nr:hypothetical protein SLG_26410 [Sphingobium sp. SYK-6]